MTGGTSLFFAYRLAWRQLFFEKGKFFAAILGVMFACILVFMQLGFRDSLYNSMSIIPNALNGDIFIQHKQTEAIWRTISFKKSELMRAYAIPDVIDVSTLYFGFAPLRNPENFSKRTIMIYGYTPESKIFNSKEIWTFEDILKQKDTAIFDRTSRPEFGPIGSILANKENIGIEINDYKINFVGTFILGGTFSADGNVITSDQNFMRIFPKRNLNEIDIGVIRLKTGVDIQKIKHQLRTLLSNDINVFDRKDLAAYESNYWKTMVPIGFIFGFGVIIGLIVGMVIVYQILYTDIVNHLHEYATMKAMGYTHLHLIFIVFGSSTILAIIGFIPGLIISHYLYGYSESKMYVEIPMPPSKIIFVFFATLGMCTLSGIIAIRKLRQASPAEMF